MFALTLCVGTCCGAGTLPRFHTPSETLCKHGQCIGQIHLPLFNSISIWCYLGVLKIGGTLLLRLPLTPERGTLQPAGGIARPFWFKAWLAFGSGPCPDRSEARHRPGAGGVEPLGGFKRTPKGKPPIWAGTHPSGALPFLFLFLQFSW